MPHSPLGTFLGLVMPAHRSLFVVAAFVPCLAASRQQLATPPVPASASSSRGEVPALRRDELVAGGPEDFLEVRHVVLAGTDLEIGRALAGIAKERFEASPSASTDPLRTRAQKQFVRERFPALFERLRGVAAAYRVDLADDSIDVTSLPDPALSGGCSVVFYPPETTADHVGVMSRFYDFTTGTIQGGRPLPGKRACTSRPTVLELHPRGGLSSIAVCCYDLVSGVIDGMNSAGLCVALLAVDEQSHENAVELDGPPQVGFGSLTTLRLLLDTCRDVDEAKRALLTTKQVYELIPTHYLICDASGRSFIWERSFRGNHDWIFDGGESPQIITNYAIYKHQDPAKLPKESHPLGACNRARRLAERIAAHPERFTLDDVKRIHSAVACAPPAEPMGASGVASRTLWHSLYVPEDRTLEIDFYLRDEPDPAGGTKVVRSGYRRFTLEGTP